MKKIHITEVYLKNFVEKIRPEDEEIRKQLDVGYTWDGKIAYLEEIRPDWIDPKIIRHYPFAKIRYYKSREEWNLYWRRANGNWELYEPYPTASNIQELLEVIGKDELGCFFG